MNTQTKELDQENIEGFEVGDVVYLNSGGAPMTVEGLHPNSPDRNVACVWHDFKGCVQRSLFLPINLTYTDPDDTEDEEDSEDDAELDD